MIIIALIGSIGVGKSTLLQDLKSKSKLNLDITFECLDQFQSFKNHNPLALSYEDPTNNCVAAQLYFSDCLSTQMKQAIACQTETDFLLTDRSLFCTIPFIKTQFRCGLLSEFTKDYLIERSNIMAEDTLLQTKTKYSGAIYLDAPPQLSLDRIASRGRNIESSLSLNYLTVLREEVISMLDWWKERCGAENVLFINTDDLPVLNEKVSDFITKFI